MTRTISTKDGKPVFTRLEKHQGVWFASLESEGFTARLPLTSFIASLLAKKASKGCIA